MNDRLNRVHASRSAAVKAGLNHPVIDTDVHVNDYAPVLEDYVAQYGRNKLATRRAAQSTSASERSTCAACTVRAVW